MPPVVLTIAGSDSSGGAGIQADIKTITTIGCYGASVITALTAQNTIGVQSIHAPPPEFVRQQLQSVIEDIRVNALKTGMLHSTDTVHMVAETLKAHYEHTEVPPLVLDPVCVSTSGHTLLNKEAISVLDEELVPLAALLTPNRMEAEALLTHRGTPRSIGCVKEMIEAAILLSSIGCAAVLLKGGHLRASLKEVQRMDDDLTVFFDGGYGGRNMEVLSAARHSADDDSCIVDVLAIRDGGVSLYVRPLIASTNTHGTGCTLSAAIASFLSLGHDLHEAVRLGTAFTQQGIAEAFPMGNGHGPLNHMHGMLTRVIPSPTPSNPTPLTRHLIQSNADIWRAYVEHDFVRQLGSGTLPLRCFKRFVIQDYLYLRYYSRAYALLAAKADTLPAVKSAATAILNVVTEQTNYVAFCAEWDITAEELDSAIETSTCTAYGAYLIDVGVRGDYAALVMALGACLLGYGEVGLWLQAESRKPGTWVKQAGNQYRKWMDEYAGEKYQSAVKTGIEVIEECARTYPPSQRTLQEWTLVWAKCTRFERAFWDMSLDLL